MSNLAVRLTLLLSGSSSTPYHSTGTTPENLQKLLRQMLGGFKKALRGVSVEAPKPDSGAFSGRFGSDSGVLPGRNSDFWCVTPTFDL